MNAVMRLAVVLWAVLVACVRCGTGKVAWCTDPDRHGDPDPDPMAQVYVPEWVPKDHQEIVDGCTCPGRFEGRHDMMCEWVLRGAGLLPARPEEPPFT